MKTTSPSIKLVQPATLAALAIAIICGVSASPAQAGYIVTLQQVGADVVATGTGPIDLTGLTFIGNFNDVGGLMVPSVGAIVTGPQDAILGVPSALYQLNNLSGPTSFGSGDQTNTKDTSSGGDLVAIIPNSPELHVPVGYSSGNPLSDSSTYSGQTFTSLGVTPGTYVWTWGTGVNQNFTLVIPGAGVPDSGSTFGLLFLSLIGLFGLNRLRHVQLA